MCLSAFAPAKVNLFLHVGAADPESGYHPVASLMVFADVGDQVSVAGADHLDFALDGAFARDLAGEPVERNLVWRAAQALLAEAGRPVPPFRLLLTKNLPVAAGLGGGSSDAGAALRLLRQALGLHISDERLLAIAASLGADGPACLVGAPVVGEGWGERLAPAPRLPVLNAVLVNPGVACPTGAVYRAFDTEPGAKSADLPPIPDDLADAFEAAAFLSHCRNDLEPPARALVPEVGDVLETLRGEPETLLARLSGSGATCFALCAGDMEAETLAERLSALRPDWWVRRCRLGGPWTD